MKLVEFILNTGEGIMENDGWGVNLTKTHRKHTWTCHNNTPVQLIYGNKKIFLFINLFIYSLFFVVYLRQDLYVAQGGLKLHFNSGLS
jgi:hypothetical protein